jgi:tetratricopeptide (TPR) repeat protein
MDAARAKWSGAGLCVLLILPLMLLRTPALISTWLSNQGSLLLFKEQRSLPLSVIPRCAPQLEHLSAVVPFEQALRFNPRNQRAWLYLGRSAWLRGECEPAVSAWQQAIHLSPRDVMAQLEITHALYASGRTEQALAAYRAIGAAGYFYGRSQQAQKGGDLRAALTGYELSMAIAPTRQAADPLAVLYLTLSHEPQSAAATWRKLAAATDANQVDHWWAIGQAAEVDKDWDAAVQAYQRAIPLEKDGYQLYTLYIQAGNISRYRQSYAEAEHYFELARVTNPKSMWPYLYLGFMEQDQKHYDAALSWYRQADQVDPQSESPKYYQAALLWSVGRKLEARDLLVRADAQNPKNAYVKLYLGLVAHDQGDLTLAIEYLRQAIVLYPGTPVDWMKLLGDWYVQTGRCADSVAAYRQALEWQPGDAATLQRLENMKKICP